MPYLHTLEPDIKTELSGSVTRSALIAIAEKSLQLRRYVVAVSVGLDLSDPSTQNTVTYLDPMGGESITDTLARLDGQAITIAVAATIADRVGRPLVDIEVTGIGTLKRPKDEDIWLSVASGLSFPSGYVVIITFFTPSED